MKHRSNNLWKNSFTQYKTNLITIKQGVLHFRVGHLQFGEENRAVLCSSPVNHRQFFDLSASRTDVFL